MTKRIFRTILLVALLVLLVCMGLITGVMYGSFEENMLGELKNGTSYIAAGVQQNGLDYLSTLPSSGNRITWVAADGTVLYDSKVDASTLENHSDREEIYEALTGQEGESYRYSDTLSEKTLYYALRLDDGTVLRISSTQSSLLTVLWGMLQPMLLIGLAAALLSGILASKLSKRIIAPINGLDLEHPESCEAYDELTPLFHKLQHQKIEIQERICALRNSQNELAAITANMNEGLIVLSQGGDILSINASAARLFQVSGEQLQGQKLIALNRSDQLAQVAEQALAGKPASAILELRGRSYALYASPVPGHRGAVLLVLDVTEKQQAEALRREFSANVSHELKTPLTSISGYAEIIRNGLVDPEDIPAFAGRIYGEANRLLALIRDIIRLSSLDEGVVDSQREPVELLALCAGVCNHLQAAAQKAQVSLRVDGETATVFGVRSILEEMVYNLCDNAIKYNRPQGSVVVSVHKKPGAILLQVTDTGIGIPPEHREKVFERFYRVDKSHSKQTGGTGLGLSIVKHGAAYHNASVSLSEAPGGGTCAQVRFPL